MSLPYALRTLRKSPLLTVTLVLSLGIGTGANAAVFNLISALFLRAPEGIRDAGSLVTIHPDTAGPASFADFDSLRGTGRFRGLAAYDDSVVTGAGLDGTFRRARIASVTGDFFRVLRMEASQGRPLDANDTGTVVISDTLWRAFGSPDLSASSKALVIEKETLPIVGVMPPRFQGLHMGRTTDVWRLLRQPATDEGRSERSLSLIGRLADHGATIEGFSIRDYSFLDADLAGKTSLLAMILAGASGLVLLCACVTAASLLLSRGNARRKDFAVKLALGAERRQLITQLLLESAIVGLMAGVAGLLFAHWTTRVIPSLFAPEHAAMLDARLSAGIIATTLGGAALLGIALNLMPARLGTVPASLLELRGDAGAISQEGPGVRAQTILVITQMAVATTLVVGALLLHRGLERVLEGELGRRTADLAVLTLIEPDLSFNPLAGSRDHQHAMAAALKMPGVVTTGLSSKLPLQRPVIGGFQIEMSPGVMQRVELDMVVVSTSYFWTLETPVIQGRGFRDTDVARGPLVAIIDETTQRRFFGSANAVGRHLLDDRGDRVEIVGVVRSGRDRTMQEAPVPAIYLPSAQHYLPRMHVLVRTTGDPEALIARLGGIQPGHLRKQRIETLDNLMAESLVMERFATLLVTASGAMALLLSILGAYSLMADSVQRRTREIGLRIALGAGALRIARSVFGYGLGLAATGIAIGLALTFATDRTLRVFTFGLPGLDLMMVLRAAGALLLVVTLAAILPMRRALRVSPTIALRHT